MAETTPAHQEDNGWPPKAYKNLDFLNSPAARSIRVMCELAEPAARFRRERVRDTIVFFGSARTVPEELARAELAAAERALEQLGHQAAESARATAQEAVRRASAKVKAAPNYEAARALARELTEWSLKEADGAPPLMVCSGGGPGIMEAANRGAQDAGGKSVGLGISLPFEQGINAHVPDELAFEFHYFFIRKYWFMYLAKAMVIFPGGFGTFDELFEVLTLLQTRKVHKRVPIVLYDTRFWKHIISWDLLIEWGVISAEDIDLFTFVDSVPQARDHIIESLKQRGEPLVPPLEQPPQT